MSNGQQKGKDEAKLNENQDPKTPPKKDTIDMIEITIPMKGSDAKATLKFPENYTDADMDKIARIVKAYKDMATEEKNEEKKAAQAADEKLE